MTAPNLTSEELWNFPCDYSVKVFGKTCDELHSTVRTIVERHTDVIHPNNIRVNIAPKVDMYPLHSKLLPQAECN